MIKSTYTINMRKLIYLLAICNVLLFGNAWASEDGYSVIAPPQPTQSGNKIEVVEVFWYGCPHCYDFEPYIEKWLETRPDDVEFRLMPGIFRKSWIPHAKAYFTAEKLGVINKIHRPLFTAIHKYKKKISDQKSLEDFFEDHGIDPDEFNQVYESEEINIKVQQAFIMGQRYKVTGTPAIVVNGKYMISGSTASSFADMLKVTDKLIAKERRLAAKE